MLSGSPNLVLQPAEPFLIDPMSRVPPVVVRLKDNHPARSAFCLIILFVHHYSHASHRRAPPQSPHNSCCRQKCFLHRPPPIILFVHQLLSGASSRLNFLELNEGGDCLYSALIWPTSNNAPGLFTGLVHPFFPALFTSAGQQAGYPSSQALIFSGSVCA